VSNQVKVKFRRSAALAVAAGITVIGGIPLLAESVWFLPILSVPLAITIWAWRAGTDVDERGFTVRALFGRRRVSWEAVDGLVTDGASVQARLANGHLVPLDAVRPADLPRVIKASGQDLQTDGPDAGRAERPEAERPEDDDPEDDRRSDDHLTDDRLKDENKDSPQPAK